MSEIERMIATLEDRYKERTRKSFRVFQRAEKVMVKGGSHSLRLYSPYPFFIRKASGSHVIDLDGNDYIDYWQGHYANILGHNPDILQAGPADRGPGTDSLHTGFEVETQVELAELLLERIGWPGHKVRFTTSGTLATMYAVMLAQGATGRDEVLKVGGGWHGASPFLLKGVKFDPEKGFGGAESAGVPAGVMRKIRVTRFNDPEDLELVFRRHGGRIACFIVEPFLGVGGFLPADREYLRTARRLADEYGTLLIFDEIISGFRFGPTAVQTLYGVEPDLSTFGKVIGGGHAVAAVTGKSDLLDRVQLRSPRQGRVQFEGGTFSAHAQYMRAGLVMLRHLVRRSRTIYPRLASMGMSLRSGVEAAFRAEGIEARCTGGGNDVVPAGSLFMVNFPRTDRPFTTARDVWDPRLVDIRLREDVLKLALMTLDVHVVHGGGAVSAAHEDADIERTIEAYGEVARLFKRFGVS